MKPWSRVALTPLRTRRYSEDDLPMRILGGETIKRGAYDRRNWSI